MCGRRKAATRTKRCPERDPPDRMHVFARVIPSPDAALGDGDGAARRPNLSTGRACLTSPRQGRRALSRQNLGGGGCGDRTSLRDVPALDSTEKEWSDCLPEDDGI